MRPAPLILLCARAAATLRELGFVQIVPLDGGMKAWRDEQPPWMPGSEP